MAIALIMSLGFTVGAGPIDVPVDAPVPVAKSDHYLVVFYADWCGPCQNMKRSVWPNSQIQELVKDYKNGKIYWVNVDKEKEYVRKYKIRGIPTVMVIDSSGKPLKRATGYMTVQQVKEFLSAQLIDTGHEQVISYGAITLIKWAIIEFAKLLLQLLS